VKRIVSILFLSGILLSSANAAILWTEGFENTFPPAGWITNSIDQNSTYAFNGTYSARLNAIGDYLITPQLTQGKTLIFWTYTTASDPLIVVEHSAGTNGPWTEAAESPFSGYTEQWNGQFIDLTSLGDVFVRFRKSGTGTLYIDDVSLEVDDVIPGNHPPVLDMIGNQSLTVSNTLSFSVTASDADNDAIVLSASNLPPGAVFNTVTNAGGVTNLFIWSNASPTGTYTTTFCAADGITNDFETITITVTDIPVIPLTGAVWNVTYNCPQQLSSGTALDQFGIRDALIARINALQNGNSATLTTFTFSADEGAGAVINAISAALDRGAHINFIADGGITLGTVYGGTNSLLSLSLRPSNPLTLAVSGSSGGIMHDKLGLFDYGGTNQWVFTASWNFTLAASANQWNIALEARSPSLYAIYTNETAEFLANRFHDNPAKSHAHDGAAFTLDGSWGTNFVRFAPYPDSTQGGNNAERDITNLIAQAQSEIVFALNKLNRTPIRDALIAAANRGVSVKGVMPKSDTDPGGVSAVLYSDLTNSASYSTTNIVQFFPAYSKADYSALDAGEPDLIHAKYMVIDPESTNAVVIHGSANWTYSALVSDNDNDENIVFLRHNGIAEKFYKHFQRITGTGLFAGGNSTVAEWNFTASNQASGGLAVNSTQTVNRVPAPAAYDAINGTLSCGEWNNGAGTKYWETSFSTEKHTAIKVSSVQTASSTGPAFFKLQYKIGADSTYADVTNATVRVPNGGNGLLTRVSLPDLCNNQPVIFLRWIMTDNTSARGYDAVQSGGKGRMDNILVTGTAHDLPPVLDPIDAQTVFEMEALTFSVTASDPTDHDPFTLSAANLPPGAIFTNGLFTWSCAAPSGSYTVTFYATDKDGTDSETVVITVIPRPKLLISEIADPAETGGDAYRFVELYNAGSETIDLAADNWTLSKQVNGGSWYNIPLIGTLSPGAVWVVAYNSADFQDAYGFAPDQESSTVSGNGDDGWFLYYGGSRTNGILIDCYGEFDTDGTDTDWDYEDSRAERNNSVQQPNPVWTASEWTITPGAETGVMTPGTHGPAPEFQGLENPFVFLGDNLNLTVTAVNTVRTDVITLSATALPAGANFLTATGTNIVSSTLNWNSPTAGVYTATFAAAGSVGTITTSITITVSSSSRIEGPFHGWSGDTIFKLENGQFWQQCEPDSKTVSPALYRPLATITNVFGKRRMTVTNVTGYVIVERLTVFESAVTNAFTGLHHENVYRLADGTAWEQISFENISDASSPVTAWRWIKNNTQQLRFIDRNNIVIGTCTVKPAGVPVNAPIITEIDGWFRGWQNKRVFALANGQFWQQTSTDSSSQTLYRPAVVLTNWLQTGNWRMSLAGQPGYVSVQQLTNVTRTAIDGYFYGFGLRKIYPLSNGSWWRQTSQDVSASTRLNPEIFIWNDNGTAYLEMPDEGRRVTAEQLNVCVESTVTNTFSGLHHGNLYRLAGAGDWLQLSFENVRTNLAAPQVMLWAEGSQTNLLARDGRDVAIGTCIVADPAGDTDNDGLNNTDEILAGVDPLDPESIFRTSVLRPPASGSVLTWSAVEGRIYTIEWTPSLSEPFHPLETGITWPQNTWTDTVHSAETKGFYRIRVRLAE
jgi:phosphatidylserine/phosphatidylglycerophosphate/cardiolipin synthase-like enzyme